VAGRQRRHLAGASVELLAGRRADPQHARDVVLEVRRLAPVGAGDRPDVGRPAPAGLEREPADLGAADRSRSSRPFGNVRVSLGVAKSWAS
jgi:hypothetical protein